MQNKESQRLRECPFCGGEAFCGRTDEGMEKESFLYYVECDNCYITTPYFYNKEKAIEAWNRRHEEPKEIEFDYEAED